MNPRAIPSAIYSRLTRDRKWSASIALLGLASGVMTLWKLQDVARSEYYAAIARSMSSSWSNFFFGAIDPAGTVSLDKIPGSYWAPALFARIFGFSTWSIIAPNALAAVALVVIVAISARNLFGRTAGVIAGAIVATTPIVIAVSRSNQPQSFFLLTLAISAHFAAKALQNSSRRYLIISGIWIAVAFHTYMLQAWALWPAIIIAWFFTSGRLIKKVVDLAIAGLISLALSLSWILIVTLIPASIRPYVGGTYRNSAIEMVFGYNGLGRFSSTGDGISSSTANSAYRSFTPPFGGSAGIERIFSSAVAGQIAWLILPAVAAIFILLFSKFSKPLIAFYAIWLLTFFSMFSAVAGIHQFYTSSLAIPVAVLVAGAVTVALRARKDIQILIILNLAGLSALYFSSFYNGYLKWAAYVQVAIILISAAIIFSESTKIRRWVVPIAITSSLIFTPAAWSFDAHNHTNSINPIAGNGDGGGFGGPGGGFGGRPDRGGFSPQGGGPAGGFGEQDNSAAIAYLTAHRNGAKYLLVTFGAQSAASYITTTGENVMPIGGFDGQDPTPTLAAFKKLVASGEIRYVLVGSGDRGGRNGDAQADNEISTWVKSNCNIDSQAPTQNLYLCSAKS